MKLHRHSLFKYIFLFLFFIQSTAAVSTVKEKNLKLSSPVPVLMPKKNLQRTGILLVGQNYRNSSTPLNGCINDANNIKKFLMEYGYPENHIEVLTDEKRGMTKSEMVIKLKDLIKNCQGKNPTYNSAIITFSGHGSYRRDRDGDEEDGYDEELVFTKGRLVDDDFNEILMGFPKGTRVLIIIDACNSGTIGDLPCTYRYKRSSYRINPYQNIQPSINRKANEMPATIVIISGCKDYQTSADATLPEPGDHSRYPLWEPQGACSNAVLRVLETSPNIKILKLQYQLNLEMRLEHFSQCPTISSSHMLTEEMSLFEQ